MKVAITGGHHTSALPVIKELRNRDKDIELIWFGHKHTLLGEESETLEYKDIKTLNIPFYNLSAGKFYKTYNIFRLIKIPWGFIQALFLLLKTKPDVILSFGGYLAAPVVFSGWLLGIPSITHEQTVVTGYANKFISKFTQKILVSWEQSKKFFSNEKVVFSGLPLREEIFSSKSNEFEINEMLPTIYVTGGKTGSHIINEAIRVHLEEFLNKANIIHQCGEHNLTNDHENLINEYVGVQDNVVGKYILRKFISNKEIGEAYSKADLVISRSGAHTIMELVNLNKPAVLIPIPWSSHNEQMKNAQLLKDAGLVEIIKEKDLEKQIFSTVKLMLDNPTNYKVDKSKFNFPSEKPQKIIVDELFSVVEK